jgi:hypothetical protein
MSCLYLTAKFAIARLRLEKFERLIWDKTDLDCRDPRVQDRKERQSRSSNLQHWSD